MGHGDRVVVVGQTVTVMALMDSSQFGILPVTYGGKFLVASVETSVFLLFVAPELMLLCLSGDKLQDPSRGR